MSRQQTQVNGYGLTEAQEGHLAVWDERFKQCRRIKTWRWRLAYDANAQVNPLSSWRVTRLGTLTGNQTPNTPNRRTAVGSTRARSSTRHSRDAPLHVVVPLLPSHKILETSHGAGQQHSAHAEKTQTTARTTTPGKHLEYSAPKRPLDQRSWKKEEQSLVR